MRHGDLTRLVDDWMGAMLDAVDESPVWDEASALAEVGAWVSRFQQQPLLRLQHTMDPG